MQIPLCPMRASRTFCAAQCAPQASFPRAPAAEQVGERSNRAALKSLSPTFVPRREFSSAWARRWAQLALNSLLQAEESAAAKDKDAGPLSPKPPHHAAKAKACHLPVSWKA